MMAAGIGFRAGCGAAELVTLLRRLPGTPTVLAAPARKRGAPILAELAAALGLRLTMIEDDALGAAQPACLTRSAAAARATGFASVAEGCALAAAGPGARLLAPRIASANATAALASS